MSDTKIVNFVPPEHILDEFLARHGVKVPFDGAMQLLADLQSAFEAEAEDDDEDL